MKIGKANTLMNDTSSDMFVGVDLGGTTVSAGLLKGGSLAAVHTLPTEAARPPEDIAETIASLVELVSGGYVVKGIGIGVPVPVGPWSDCLYMSVNIPSLEGFPLRSTLEKRLGLPVTLDNDARCMALGEYRYGALSGCSVGACLTLGTGLGCGVVVDGVPFRGAHGGAGEIWTVPSGDGVVLEDRTSIRALTSIFWNLTGKYAEPSEIFKRYRRGSKMAITAFEQYGENVGDAVLTVISLFDPEKVAVGGGIAGAFEAFKPGITTVVERVWGMEAANRVVPAALSEKAAIMGAAEIARIARKK